jgi:hypothetical protein
MWEHAESRPDELDVPGTWWTVVLVQDRGRWVPAAWAAAVETTEDGERVLRCHSNFEVPRYRGRGLYRAAYAHRHATVVRPTGLPAVTHLFRQPIKIHRAHRWHLTRVAGTSTTTGEPHRWWQLRRNPSTQASRPKSLRP